MTCVVSVVNTKGGVGKTTTAFSLGAYLADKGCSVLLVDADGQGSLSKMAGYPDMLLDGEGISDFILGHAFQMWPIEGLDNIHIIRQDFELKNHDTEKTLDARKDRDMALSAAVARVAKSESRPDIVIIDTIGAECPLMDSAIIASDIMVMPIYPEQACTQETPVLLGSLNERLAVSAAVLYRDGDPDEVVCLVPPVLAFANRYRSNNGPKAHYDNLVALFKTAKDSLRFPAVFSEAKFYQREYFGDANTCSTPPHRFAPVKEDREALVATLDHLIEDMGKIAPKFKQAVGE